MSEKSSGGNKKLMVGIGISLAVLAVLGCLGWWLSVRYTVSTDNAKVSGDLVDISPEVPGKLVQLYVVEGQQVRAGQPLASLDDSQYRINLRQAQAALDIAQADYNKLPYDIKSAAAALNESSSAVISAQSQQQSAQTALSDAGRILDRDKLLFATGAISKDEMDAAQSNYDKAEYEFERLEAVVRSQQATKAGAQSKLDSLNDTQSVIYIAQKEQAQAAYDNAKRAVDNTIVTVGVSGTVMRIPVTMGENLASGQTLVTICDLDTVWIEANIDEGKAGRIKVGQKADVDLDYYPGITFRGEISEVGNASQSTFDLISTENTSGNYTKVTQRVTVKIKVDGEGYVLKPGLSAAVKIHLSDS